MASTNKAQATWHCLDHHSASFSPPPRPAIAQHRIFHARLRYAAVTSLIQLLLPQRQRVTMLTSSCLHPASIPVRLSYRSPHDRLQRRQIIIPSSPSAVTSPLSVVIRVEDSPKLPHVGAQGGHAMPSLIDSTTRSCFAYCFPFFFLPSCFALQFLHSFALCSFSADSFVFDQFCVKVIANTHTR